MINSKLIKLVYKIQDLLFQNKMPTFIIFKNEICKNYIFPSGQLEKIYAFIETIQHHSKSGALAIALTPMLKMILGYMINCIDVFYEKDRSKHCFETYDAIFKKFRIKRIICVGDRSCIVPCRGGKAIQNFKKAKYEEECIEREIFMAFQIGEIFEDD